MRTVGVEEEFLLIDRETGVPRPDGPRVVSAAARRLERPRGIVPGPDGPAEPGGDAAPELDREQVETGTTPHHRLDDLHRELVSLRRATAAAAASTGAALAATGTSPMRVEPSSSPGVRYRRIIDEFGLVGREQLTCGCHVHVSVDSDDEAIGVLDRVRPWVAPLIALTANSPFWQGEDSDYASFRTQVWGRWPTAGPTEAFGSAAAYRRHVDDLLATGTILDEGMIYFDVRPSARYPTIEIRVADVCLRTEDAVVLAGIVRALVETAAVAWAAGEPAPAVRTALLRLAQWRASRSGLAGDLVDPRIPDGTGAVPAAMALEHLLDHVRPALIRHDDLDLVTTGIKDILGRGPGAHAQRAAHARDGRLLDVTRLITELDGPGSSLSFPAGGPIGEDRTVGHRTAPVVPENRAEEHFPRGLARGRH